MATLERVQKFLKENSVAFSKHSHALAYTSQEVAAAEHVTGRSLAKVVVVRGDEGMAMAVLPASFRIDLPALAKLAGVKKMSLATEEEFGGRFPDCEVGAMPPFGNLYDLPVYVDSHMAESDEIVFDAGSHAEVMRMGYGDYVRLVKPTVGDFADGHA